MRRNDAAVHTFELREQVLSGAQPALKFQNVRAEIQRSWHRSRMCGVDPSAQIRRVSDEIRTGGDLIRSLETVVQQHWAALDQRGTSLQLTDPNGVILHRWVADSVFAHRMTRLGVEPGFSFEEASAGTNSAGIVLETRLPATVIGAEHYSDHYLNMACYGVPLIHPVTRRLLGVINLSCRESDANGFQMPWLLAFARDVRQALSDSASSRHRRLLQEFMATPTDNGASILAVNEDLVICNRHALRNLSPEDHVALRSVFPASNFEDTHTVLSLSRGKAEVNIKRLNSDLLGAGAVLRIRSAHSSGALSAASKSGGAHTLKSPRLSNRTGVPAGEGADDPLADLVGSSLAWGQVRKLAAEAALSASCLIYGEPGSGHTAVASRIILSQAAVFDCRTPPVQSLNDSHWITQILSAAQDASSMSEKPEVLFEHIEALDEVAASALAAGLEHSMGRLRIVATLSGTRSMQGSKSLHDSFHTLIELPSLDERMSDVPELVRYLTQRHLDSLGRFNRVSWSVAALEALSRQTLECNVRTLDQLVRQTLGADPFGEISIDNLPASVRSAATRRRLSGLESAEAKAIVQALVEAQRNKSVAANALGVARSTLYRRIRELGLDLEHSN